MQSNYQALVQVVLTAAQSGQPQKEVVLQLGPTPDYLIAHCGFPQLPLIIRGKTIDKVFFDHGVTKGILERLDTILQAPKALYKSETVVDGAIVVTFEMKSQEPLLVALHPNKLQGRDYVNVVASIYAKPVNKQQHWNNKGLLLWTA